MNAWEEEYGALTAEVSDETSSSLELGMHGEAKDEDGQVQLILAWQLVQFRRLLEHACNRAGYDRAFAFGFVLESPDPHCV